MDSEILLNETGTKQLTNGKIETSPENIQNPNESNEQQQQQLIAPHLLSYFSQYSQQVLMGVEADTLAALQHFDTKQYETQQYQQLQNSEFSNCISVKDKLKEIIDNKWMKPIVFRYPRFAIKSYGKERRYLCPPPHLMMRGKAWDDDLVGPENSMAPFEMQSENLPQLAKEDFFSNSFCSTSINGSASNTINNNTGFQSIKSDSVDLKTNGYHPTLDSMNGTNPNSNNDSNPLQKANQSLFYSLITIPGVDLSESGHIELDQDRSGYATRIFIPDSKDVNNGIILNSMNSFAFSLTIIKSNIPLCSFNSDYIKLKSKALSYTKQASNNASEDTCLTSGSCISLYSRIHAHKSNTRFLLIENGKFMAHPLYWDSFIIYKVSEDSLEAEFEPIPGIISYGNFVKIVSTQHNVSLPCMQILPVEMKTNVEAKPIQFLSRCSFRFRYNESKFMSLETQRDIIAEEAVIETKKSGVYHVKEEAIWTITKISSSLYSYIELAKPQYSISPFPIVESISLHGSEYTYYLKIRGFNFTPLISVWLGTVECGTFYQCKESILAVLPQFSQLSDYLKSMNEIIVPIFLIRRDLVVYPTQFDAEFRFNSLSTHPNEFVFTTKYAPFEKGLEDPEILSQNLLC